MAYGRYRRRRNFRRRGRRYTRRPASTMSKINTAFSYAKAAYTGFRYIRGLVNSEMFHTDLALTLGSAQNNIHHITGLAQGDGVSGRTGNSILAKTYSMNGYMYIAPTQTTNTRVMLALVLDKQQVEDTTPNIGSIFVDPVDPSTLLNSSNLGRFSILWRKQYTLDAITAGTPAKQVKCFKRLGFHVRYNGTTNTDIQRNGLYLVMITSEPTLYPTIKMNVRFSYHDN